ncbi:MAG: hypothetical protein AUJ97_06615 [Bacteroidetes bacterium CG2_30_32_10]|nr:MAG: hypothetical protein AUJ97_06615 [Bacteroidetes bacterium CG2_30_32_10]
MYKNTFLKIGNYKPSEYKGIQEKAAYRLHSDLFEMITPYLKEGMYALDFGCGEGAFSQRLKDFGCKVDACEIDIKQVKAKVDNLIYLDLNKENIVDNFERKYDCIIAMEVIEHIENPWKYMRDMKNLLKQDGFILISTPNISNFASRLRFFMRGSFLGFEKNDLEYGHITPLNYFSLEHLFITLDFEILAKSPAGAFPILFFVNPSIFYFLRNTILPLFYPFMRGDKKGRSLAYILKKKLRIFE